MSEASNTASVRAWPTYLLVGIPRPLRTAITLEAQEKNLSLNDVVRGILCRHYDFECPEKGQGYRRETSDRLLLRLQPEVWEKIKKDAGTEYGAIKALLVNVLETHYNGGNPRD